MNRKQYDERLSAILDEAHITLNLIHDLMTDIGGDAHTAEWSLLYEIARSAGAVTGLLYNEIREPRPSALTDEPTDEPTDA